MCLPTYNALATLQMSEQKLMAWLSVAMHSPYAVTASPHCLLGHFFPEALPDAVLILHTVGLHYSLSLGDRSTV